MTIARSEGVAVLSLSEMTAEEMTADEAPAADLPTSERPATTVGGMVLGHLRAAWSEYLTENKSGWSKLVDEQARDPTLG